MGREPPPLPAGADGGAPSSSVEPGPPSAATAATATVTLDDGALEVVASFFERQHEATVDEVREFVLAQLAKGCTPEQVRGAFGMPTMWLDPKSMSFGLPEDLAAAAARWEHVRVQFSRAQGDASSELQAEASVQALPDEVHSWLLIERHSAALVSAARERKARDALNHLNAGAAWDALDEDGRSAGSYALEYGMADLVQAFIEVGSGRVLELNHLRRHRRLQLSSSERDEADAQLRDRLLIQSLALDGVRSSAEALSSPDELAAAAHAIRDADMQRDSSELSPLVLRERSIMKAHANAVQPKRSFGQILNIGSGPSIFDKLLQVISISEERG